MLSLARSITGEMQADFWIEKVEGQLKMKIADNVKIGIRGRVVDILVTKRFDA